MTGLDRISRILVIRLACVGDVLLTTPALRTLRTSFPKAFICYLTADPAARDLLRNNPDIDECLLSTESVFDDIFRMRLFDLVLDFYGSRATQSMCLFSGAQYRVGIEIADPFGDLQPYNVAGPEISERDNVLTRFSGLTKALGLPDPPPKPILILDDSERRFAREFLRSHGIGPEDLWVALQPGRRGKRPPWSPDKFVALGNILRRKFGHPILVFQGPDDRTPIAAEVCRKLGNGVVLVAGLPIRHYAAVLERCGLLVTSEGGAGHIAAALHVRSIVLFTTPFAFYWFPYRPEDGMIALEELPGRDLSAENAAQAAERLFHPVPVQ